MAQGIITTQYLTDIANAIRAKLGASDTYTPAEMGPAIETITGGGGTDDTDFANTIMREGAITRIPDSVTSIGEYAFYQCRNLALTQLPSGVTYIGNYAFYNCRKLALTELPSGVTKIGDYAFYNCDYLALTELPSGVTSIGPSTFRGCTNLALTQLPSGVTSIGEYAFYHCTNLALTELPSGVTDISSYAFQGCTNLALTELPSGVTTISASTFYNCSSLALTELPRGVTRILNYAFYGCSGLQQLDAQNVNDIYANVFNSCSNLTELVLRKEDKACGLSSVSSFTNTPMRGYNGLTGTIYVPSALIETYKTATNWSSIYNEGHLTFAAIEGSAYERD